MKNKAGSALGRILYAEDEESARESVCALLRKEGYECDTVPDGLAAAQRLREEPYDCLIADIKMLGNANLELIRTATEIQAGLPVILVTGYPSVESAVESLKLPVVSYLVKPIDFEALLGAVRDAVFRSLLVRQFDVTRASLQQWFAEVGQLSEGLKSASRVPTSGPMDVYMMITYRNILEALMGLKTVMEHSLSVRPLGDEAPLAGPGPLVLVNALRDVIDVLEKSKDAFRSRELGDLRHRLEDLLHANEEQRVGAGR
jgi:DNA-binding response OmpR family regulator